MKLLFKLSGEHPKLPKAEILATLEGERIPYGIISDDPKSRILIIEAETEDASFIQRLAMTRRVGEFLGASKSLEELAHKVSGNICEGSFAVDGECQRIKEDLGKEIWSLGHGVDLLNPDSRILCFEDEHGRYNVAIETPLERDFNERKPHKRPFFHPTSMSPKMARVLVNLARVKRGDTILDPFCGTGGVLIEAGLMDMNVLGCDIADDMVAGCMTNLKHYGVGGKITRCDATGLRLPYSGVDAIVTDVPYGKSSFMTDRNKERFYWGFLESAAAILPKGKHLVTVLPEKESLPPAWGFQLREKYAVYVHKSLTRMVYVLQRK